TDHPSEHPEGRDGQQHGRRPGAARHIEQRVDHREEQPEIECIPPRQGGDPFLWIHRSPPWCASCRSMPATTANACFVSATSCTRTTAAPCLAATTAAATDAICR